MSFFDALADIKRQFPHLDEMQLRYAMDAEVAWEEERLKDQGIRLKRYERAVESAHSRILEWLRTGKQHSLSQATRWSVDLDSLIKFVSGRRVSAIWATLESLRMDANGTCECMNCIVCNGHLTICGKCRMCTRCHEHAAGCPGCHATPPAEPYPVPAPR